MRFGLVGTGPWAELAHGPGLIAAEGVELVGIWGRTPGRAEPLAQSLGVTAYDDYAALLTDVEAVAFAVPPAVQAEMALEAAVAGRHLLLDKPVATDPGAARTLLAAATEAGVASVVFFTDRFVDATRTWIDQARGTEGWHGGWVRWFSALQEPDNPFGASPWRHEAGAPQRRNRLEHLRQRHIERDVQPHAKRRSADRPQAEHRLVGGRHPEEGHLARRNAMRQGQSQHVAVERD